MNKTKKQKKTRGPDIGPKLMDKILKQQEPSLQVTAPAMGTITISEHRHHRNGVGGAPFVAVKFNWRPETRCAEIHSMMATIAYTHWRDNMLLDPETCRVIDLDEFDECFHGARFGTMIIEALGKQYNN